MLEDIFIFLIKVCSSSFVDTKDDLDTDDTFVDFDDDPFYFLALSSIYFLPYSF